MDVGQSEMLNFFFQASDFTFALEGGNWFRVWGQRNSIWRHVTHGSEARVDKVLWQPLKQAELHGY